MKIKNISPYDLRFPTVGDFIILSGETIEVSEDLGKILCKSSNIDEIKGSPKKKTE